MVPPVGLEPTRRCRQQILSVRRMAEFRGYSDSWVDLYGSLRLGSSRRIRMVTAPASASKSMQARHHPAPDRGHSWAPGHRKGAGDELHPRLADVYGVPPRKVGAPARRTHRTFLLGIGP